MKACLIGSVACVADGVFFWPQTWVPWDGGVHYERRYAVCSSPIAATTKWLDCLLECTERGRLGVLRLREPFSDLGKGCPQGIKTPNLVRSHQFKGGRRHRGRIEDVNAVQRPSERLWNLLMTPVGPVDKSTTMTPGIWHPKRACAVDLARAHVAV